MRAALGLQVTDLCHKKEIQIKRPAEHICSINKSFRSQADAPTFDMVHIPVLPKLSPSEKRISVVPGFAGCSAVSGTQVSPQNSLKPRLFPSLDTWASRNLCGWEGRKEAGFGGDSVPEEQVTARADAAGEARAAAGEAEHTKAFAHGCGHAQGRDCSCGGDGARGKPEPLPWQRPEEEGYAPPMLVQVIKRRDSLN